MDCKKTEEEKRGLEEKNAEQEEEKKIWNVQLKNRGKCKDKNGLDYFLDSEKFD